MGLWVMSDDVSDDVSWTFLSRFWGLVTHPFLLNVGMFLLPLRLRCGVPIRLVSRSLALHGSADDRQRCDPVVL